MKILFILLTCPLFATTYYLNGSAGNDANSCTTAKASGSSAKKTLSSALTCLAAGDTLIVQSGTYSSAFTSLPNGSTGKYTVIKAETDGGVIFTGSVDFAHNNTYIQVEGMRFESANQKNILGNHLKFFRTGFRGGPPNGNTVTMAVGTNDYNDTADILFEDCWSYGLGGRYNIIVYNADRVVFRRLVVRHDGGWDGSLDMGDPEAAINFYDSSNCWCLNCIAVDSSLTYFSWTQPVYLVNNTSVSHSTDGNGFIGTIILNNSNVGLRADGSITNTTLTDVAAIDNTNGGISLGGTGSTSTRLTILTKNVSLSGDYKYGAGALGTNHTITNAIVANMTGDFLNIASTYFDTYNNGHTSSGTGKVTYNPASNGLSYLTRIESGSSLKTAGTNGGQLGAQIINQIGASGALVGDSNWNVDTGVTLWPWPNESRIKTEMCTNAAITRGFCAKSSLTDYVWSYLGNPTPPNLGGGLACDVNGDGVVDQNDVSAAKDQTLTIVPCTTADLVQPGSCTVVDVQRIINVVTLGMACRTGL